MSKKTRLVLLLAITLVLSAVYWGFGNTAYTLPITISYFVLCLLLSVAYLLVNGGLRPLMEEDRKREARSREKYLADKAKEHPVKPRDKYRRFRIKSEKEEKIEPERSSPAPNPLGIPEEKRPLLSQILLVVTVPFYLIFMIDMILLKFFL